MDANRVSAPSMALVTMNSDLDYFEWQAPTGGVHALTVESPTMVHAVVHPTQTGTQDSIRVVAPTQNEWRSYHPIRDYSGLFLVLADTPATEDGIVGFASRFGLLWRAPKAQSEHLRSLDIWEPGHRPASGESLWNNPRLLPVEAIKDWQHSISILKQWTDAWRTNRAHFAANGKNRRSLEATIARNVAHAGGVSFTLIDGRIRYAPDSLHSALWHQFAFAVAENKEYRRCKIADCPRGRWYEIHSGVTLGAHRGDAYVCSRACGKRYLRERRARVLDLHAKGASLTRIGIEVKTLQGKPTPRTTILRWIKDNQRTARTR